MCRQMDIWTYRHLALTERLCTVWYFLFSLVCVFVCACATVHALAFGCPSSSGPILALVLAKENAIAEWRKLLGPTSSKRARQEDPDSLRAKYGKDDTRNGLHGSDSQYSAEREIRFIFPGSESRWGTL